LGLSILVLTGIECFCLNCINPLFEHSRAYSTHTCYHAVTICVIGGCSMDEIDIAYKDALRGQPSTRPLIEMTIPSVLDNTIAPPGCVQTNFHVYIRRSYRSKEPVLRVCVLTTRWLRESYWTRLMVWYWASNTCKIREGKFELLYLRSARSVVDVFSMCHFLCLPEVCGSTQHISCLAEWSGKHVINMFVQYTPFHLTEGSWEDKATRVCGTSPWVVRCNWLCTVVNLKSARAALRVQGLVEKAQLTIKWPAFCLILQLDIMGSELPLSCSGLSS
jgi:hypothetical protein